jgi:sec-independent protein translocase protein TatA
MFGLGIKEIVIIAVVLIVLFGSRKIPEVAQSLVDAVRTLRKVFDSSDDTTTVVKK